MAGPLSNDLRERVVAAVGMGESCRSVAKRFGVAVSSVVKWSQRYRATGSVGPGKMGGHRKRVLEPHRSFIIERIAQTPHLTLHGLKRELAERGVKVSHNAVWLFLRREGLSFKKNAGRRASTPNGWCSSMRPGSRPTWRPCAVGAARACGCAALLRTATGAP